MWEVEPFLKPIRSVAAAQAENRHGIIRFSTCFSSKTDLPETANPAPPDEAMQVLKFFEDLAEQEHRWKFAAEKFQDGLEMPMLTYCQCYADVLQEKVTQTPIRTGTLLDVLRKYGGRRGHFTDLNFIPYLHNEAPQLGASVV